MTESKPVVDRNAKRRARRAARKAEAAEPTFAVKLTLDQIAALLKSTDEEVRRPDHSDYPHTGDLLAAHSELTVAYMVASGGTAFHR